MMLRKEIDENIPWRTLNIQKKKGLTHYDVESMDRPYCIYSEDGWIAQKRELQLEKAWDLYDLAQEFLSENAKKLYSMPTKPRPTGNKANIIEDDADNDDVESEDNVTDLHDMFDAE